MSIAVLQCYISADYLLLLDFSPRLKVAIHPSSIVHHQHHLLLCELAFIGWTHHAADELGRLEPPPLPPKIGMEPKRSLPTKAFRGRPSEYPTGSPVLFPP